MDDTELNRRAAVHSALSDPSRLAIVDALALSDRAPSDLAEALGVGSNLLAHHLAVLAAAGLVESTVSSGDRRRRYVRLREAARPYASTPVLARPGSMLFVCKANSARSQLALALWRQREAIEARSAGTAPADRVHPGALAAAQRHGLDLGAAVPGAVQDIAHVPDVVVTVCDEANEALDLTGRITRLHWSVPDPVADGQAEAFDRVVEVLGARIDAFRSACAA